MPGKSPKREKSDGGGKPAKVKDIWLQLLTRQRDMEIAAQETADRELDEALAAVDKEEKAGEEGADSVETKQSGEGGEGGGAAKELTPEEQAAAEAKAKEEAEAAEADARARELMALKPLEHVLIVCGAKAGGKSTFVNNFLNPTKEYTAKPTTALEYSFGRKVRGMMVWSLTVGMFAECGGGRACHPPNPPRSSALLCSAGAVGCSRLLVSLVTLAETCLRITNRNAGPRHGQGRGARVGAGRRLQAQGHAHGARHRQQHQQGGGGHHYRPWRAGLGAGVPDQVAGARALSVRLAGRRVRQHCSRVVAHTCPLEVHHLRVCDCCAAAAAAADDKPAAENAVAGSLLLLVVDVVVLLLLLVLLPPLPLLLTITRHSVDPPECLAAFCTFRYRGSGEIDQKVVDRLEKQAKLRVKRAADRDAVSPTTIPVVIVCTKMDVFQEQATNKRKALLSALRYHAHINGASILAVCVAPSVDIYIFGGGVVRAMRVRCVAIVCLSIRLFVCLPACLPVCLPVGCWC
jgi:hypothetical protein